MQTVAAADKLATEMAVSGMAHARLDTLTHTPYHTHSTVEHYTQSDDRSRYMTRTYVCTRRMPLSHWIGSDSDGRDAMESVVQISWQGNCGEHNSQLGLPHGILL